jgi:hypothetical protein
MGIKSGIMRKEIFNKELIEKYRDENGWISAIYKPEEFFNDSEKKRREVTVMVSLKNNRVTVVKRMYWEYSNSWNYSRNLGASVTAWQPLPELYKKVI